MNLIGYLDTNGKFFPCNSYGHMSKAEEIVDELNLVEAEYCVFPEATLLKNGFIVFRITDVYKGTYDDNRNILFITEAQQNWIDKHHDEFNQRQLAYIEEMIKYFGVLYNYHLKKQKKENPSE